jgi:hypothetical protein
VKKRVLALGLVAALIALPMAASAGSHNLADETDDLAMIWDLLIVRPVAIVAMAVGAFYTFPPPCSPKPGTTTSNPSRTRSSRRPTSSPLSARSADLTTDGWRAGG